MSTSLDLEGQVKKPEQSSAYSTFAYGLLALFIMAISLAVILSAKKDFDSEFEGNIKRAQDTALIYEDQVGQTFQLIENVARTLQFSTDRSLNQSTPDELRLILQRAQFSLPAIRSMSLVNDEEIVFASSSRENLGLKIDLKHFEPTEDTSRTSGSLRISQPWSGRDLSNGRPSSIENPIGNDDAYFIPILLRLSNTVAQSNGIWILVTVNPDYLLGRLSRYNDTKTDGFELIRIDGRVLLSENVTQPGKFFNESNLLPTILASKKSINTEQDLLAFRVSAKYPMFVATRIDREELIQSWLNKKLPFFSWIIASALAGVLICWILLSRIKVTEKNQQKQQRVVYRLSQALAQSPSGILITNLNGVVEYCNSFYCQMVEKNSLDIIGSLTFMFDPKIIPTAASADIIQTLISGHIWTGEFAHKNSAENSTREVQVIWSPLRDENNVISHFICVEHDISQLKKMQTELSISRDRAEAATRAKSEFLANMSHEIRTPMSGVIGMTHLALEEEMGEKAREYVTNARTSGVTLLGILNDILDFSKMEAGKLQLESSRFDFHDWLNSIVKPHAMAAKDKGLYFHCEVASDVPAWIKSDSLRLSQILNNLIGNAIKFTTLGKVELFVRYIQKYNQLQLHEAEYFLEFTVKDTGCGMTSSEIENLFKPFTQANYSTSRVYGGTGLGLVICKRLCLAFNGDIFVTSQPQIGSTFGAFVSILPAHAPEIELSVVSERTIAASSPQRDLNGLKVLLVEDYPFNRQMMMVLLGKFGLEVDVAVNGQDALEKLHSPGSYYDAVLMDIQMPIMDGISATRQIRSESIFDDLPIIAVTANAMRDEREICLQAGMQEYLVKPIDRTALFDSLVTWAGRGTVVYSKR
jgi:signal transduction histidine kinase/ActR/RegA family two-component response regulator